MSIGLHELEAIRLADLDGLYQDAATQQMGISRQTYARILTRRPFGSSPRRSRQASS